jgi:cell division protein FtsI/penicillin-binding protein 2
LAERNIQVTVQLKFKLNIREIIYPKSYGKQTLVQALQNSSNTGFVQIGQKLGKEDLYRYIRGFGLEGRTELTFPEKDPATLYQREEQRYWTYL